MCAQRRSGGETGEWNNTVLTVIVYGDGIEGVFCFLEFYNFSVIYMYFS